MANPENTRRLWSLGLFALPLVAVKVAAMMLGGASQRAGAASHGAVTTIDPVAAATPGVSRVEWSSEQQAAAAHVGELEAAPFGPSPMVYTREAEPEKPVVAVPEPQPTIVMDEPASEFALHAVMVAPNGDKALINGRMYESGQHIDDGPWMVGEINVSDRSVTLHNVETRELLVIRVLRPR